MSELRKKGVEKGTRSEKKLMRGDREQDDGITSRQAGQALADRTL